MVVRALWQQAVTPRTGTQLQSFVEGAVGELLDPLLPAGKLEVMSELARPLTTAVLAALLGDPAIDGAGQDVSLEYFVKLVAALPDRQSSQEPQESFIRKLLSVADEGEHLTRDEVAAACYFLMTAARRALPDTLGNTLLLLSLQPNLLERLRRIPAPIYSTVEEALRYLPPVWTAHRTVITPMALGRQNLPPGAHVCAWIISANHDPAQFAHPERFDIERIPNRHLSFGDNGPFACLGSGLARLVARLTLAAIARRISGFELAPGAAVEVAAPGDRCSLTKLAVVFEARV
jgi:cytochrome P450